MKLTTEEAAQVLREVTTHHFTRQTSSGSVLEIYVGEGMERQIARTISAALNRGEAIILADGTKKWRHTVPIIHTERQGSDQYEWDSAGNRVRAERIEYVQSPDGQVVSRILARMWRLF